MSNTDKTVPIEASADGKLNAYTSYCPVVGHQRNYAVCLHLCAERKQGRLDVRYSDCSAAIGQRRCPALSMRKEEIAVGHAIYFTERFKFSEGLVERAKEYVTKAVLPPTRAKSEPAQSKMSVLNKIDDSGYAKAINSVIERESKSSEVPKVEAKPGESLLDMARRLMGK